MFRKLGNKLFLGISIVLTLGLFLSVSINVASAKFGECPNGYFFDARSGVGCKQTYCNDIENAHWSYEGRCVCGSSGSNNENPKDPNKECYFPQADTSCPGCVASCVHFDEKCPGEFGVSDTQEPGESAIDKGLFWMIEDAFSTFMSIGGDLLEAATGIKLSENIESDAFYEGRVIFTNGQQADVRLLHLNLAGSKENGLAFEFNVFEIKTPSQDAFIDEWSIGIGLGSISKDGGSTDVPFTPISPGVNFNNIRRYFAEQWNDVRYWWGNNAPWFLGGDEPSPIGGTR